MSAAPEQLSEDIARVIEDARRFGMDAEQLANLAGALNPPAATGGGIWPENVAIVCAFLAVSTQWRTVPRGGGGFASPFGGAVAPIAPMFIGLDYAAARAGLDGDGIIVTPELWRGLRVMEAEACSVLNEVSR